jgi:pyruvate/2-oxoglutarate dehydrogenase complex dihydrolipoamide acyltransferase (E2) component
MRSPLARHSWTSDFPLWRLQSFAPACAQRPWRPIAPQMDGVISLRKRLLPLAEGRGARLTYMPIIIKALSVALEDFPEINATLSPDHSTITYRGR